MIIGESNDFGALLRHTRKTLGITQTFLSQESKITRAVISGIELGKIKNPHLDTVIRISNVLNLGVFIQSNRED
ncbi:helix-turn-helix domain-containing protein [Aggregatimonas sangjinii]|uniref:Helix-turn-helix domain-containing protein n=1 Tax=Aggregatimonas sangjinii TaxID=2583587 RepID=A0A5B7SV38_9FLAO|nr:helix-turn-helix transcriptional regulator [Aggregatimonas sangjinii]QCX01149.1 helix-turn-helix domain-containing protein [Aggregatimonas sangjinii]